MQWWKKLLPNDDSDVSIITGCTGQYILIVMLPAWNSQVQPCYKRGHWHKITYDTCLSLCNRAEERHVPTSSEIWQVVLVSSSGVQFKFTRGILMSRTRQSDISDKNNYCALWEMSFLIWILLKYSVIHSAIVFFSFCSNYI